MQQQGWQAGQSLGARASRSGAEDDDDDAARLAASRVGVLYKDDTLGLGAQLKSKDVQHQKTGLDAFQGLLGRLNSKNEEELKVVEKKIEDKKLAMFAQGRWGGMVFVPGGVLVQGDDFKKKDVRQAKTEESEEQISDTAVGPEADDDDDARRKAEKKKRKEERRARKEERRASKAAKAKVSAESSAAASDDEDTEPEPLKGTKVIAASAPDEPISSTDEEANCKASQNDESNERKQNPSATVQKTSTKQVMRNGRHLLRGRNIQAKRMAFSDAKGLDEIFMKKQR